MIIVDFLQYIDYPETTSDEGGKIYYEVREGARLHFISFETRQIEKVATDLKLHNLLSIFDNHRSKLYANLHSKNQEVFYLYRM